MDRPTEQGRLSFRVSDEQEDLIMNSIRALGLAAIVSVGLASAAFAVTGNDSAGKPNGTAGMTQTSPTEPGKTGSYAGGQTSPSGTGTSVGPGAADRDTNKPLGYGKGAGENSSVGKR
jgi:hypothetical protein